MSWLQLRLDCEPSKAALLEDYLLEAGALSVTLEDRADQPLLEPAVGTTPLWDAIRITGLFTADHDMDSVLRQLPDQSDTCSPRVDILEDKDWTREWMQHYQPMQFGQRLWICPSWIEPPDPDAINLLLDPGLAFGTGTHPTTALCLQALDSMDLTGSTVVDFGCGSGVLGIAALKLGAQRLLAVDNDPQALTATAENARRNGISNSAVHLALPGEYEERVWHGQADLVLANILAGPLATLRDSLCDLLAPGGRLVLAGLLDTQAESLIEHYAPRVRLSRHAVEPPWECLSGHRVG